MAFGRVLCFSRLDAAKRSLTIYQAEIKKEFKNKKTRVLETLQARKRSCLCWSPGRDEDEERDYITLRLFEVVWLSE